MLMFYSTLAFLDTPQRQELDEVSYHRGGKQKGASYNPFPKHPDVKRVRFTYAENEPDPSESIIQTDRNPMEIIYLAQEMIILTHSRCLSPGFTQPLANVHSGWWTSLEN